MKRSVGPPAGLLVGDPQVLALLLRAGIRTAGECLARAETVRRLPRRTNLRLDIEGRCWHLKLERGRRASREAWVRQRLARAGVPVAPIAFQGHDETLGALSGTEDLFPRRPLDVHLAQRAGSSRECRTLLAGLAKAVARLHEAGWHHRDLYLNHVLADPREDPPLVLIDLERAGGHAWAFSRWVVKDLAALRVSCPPSVAGLFPRFLRRYLRERGREATRGAAHLLRRVERKAERMRRHVPRTPVGEAAR